MTTTLQLSDKTLADIARNVAKYPPEQKQSAVMASLIAAQTEIGWVSPEVATFYNMYNTKPIGKYKLVICTNLPCQLTHGETAATYLKETLGIGYNETTPCGTFTLKEGECMGACGDSPIMLVNDKRMCSFMSKEKIDALLNELRAEGKAA
jgi:NADH-quinone oxidoreductase subunit E